MYGSQQIRTVICVICRDLISSTITIVGVSANKDFHKGRVQIMSKKYKVSRKCFSERVKEVLIKCRENGEKV